MVVDAVSYWLDDGFEIKVSEYEGTVFLEVRKDDKILCQEMLGMDDKGLGYFLWRAGQVAGTDDEEG